MPVLQIQRGTKRARLKFHRRVAIGRTLDNRLVIPDADVLPSHACIDGKNGQYYIEELDAGATTLVNNQYIVERCPLRDGDVIKIGRAVIQYLEGPSNPSTVRTEEAGAEPKPVLIAEVADEVEEICSICQSVIEPDEPRTACEKCNLPFHTDCWQENFGCAAYGCENVNVLKPGPDVRIDGPPALPTTALPAPAMPATAPPGGDEMPWEYLLLAACAVLSLAGALLYGILALVGMGATIAYAALRPQRARMEIMIGCFIVSGLGFVFGLVLSIYFWW